ncbi:MAG: zinc-dependent metalloprotease [Bacteroidota bacterium]
MRRLFTPSALVRLTPAFLLTLLLVAGGCSSSKLPDTTPPAAPEAPPKDDDSPYKPFAEVVTDSAAADSGLFVSYLMEDDTKLLYAIPDSVMGREMLLVTRVSKTADNLAYGGTKFNTQTVRWERKGRNILLRTVSYSNVAADSLPIYSAVRNSNFEPVVASFGIEAITPDSAGVVIDATKLYTSDVPSLGLPSFTREQYRVRRLDGSRSFLERVASYPENIEVRVVLTYDAARPPSQSSTGSISVEMAHSMILLPEEPMTPRLADERVGYFTRTQTDFGREEQRAEQRSYAIRWRLEPSDEAAYARGELVEPKQQIVYYIDPATPERWRPYLKQGVDDWNVAFEAAGFKNAIVAKDPPTPEEDPEFNPEDVRYSVIRYFASDIQNAYGPNVHDPRSGEILESDIGWYHNIQNLLRNWYFVQTAAANPEARGVEFDDAVMGELIRFVSAHEVGHTIGLQHNFFSSSTVPVDSLRSPTYTAKHGTAPSIMDYARFNYIAQPGDGVQRFTPDIGSYDIHAIEWGYRYFPGIDDADDERPLLHEIVRRTETDPTLRYVRQAVIATDPRAQNEDLGDDAVYAGELGLANLKRIINNLRAWTDEPMEDYATLDELYNQIAFQWLRYLNHAGSYVGGVYTEYKTADQDGAVYEPVPADRQREALAFVLEHGMQRPDWLLDTEILRRVEAAGVQDQIRGLQASVLGRLMSPWRIARLFEAEAVDAMAESELEMEVFTATELFDTVRGGLWSELDGGDAIDPMRRALQRAYLEQLESLMTEEPTPPPNAFFRFYIGYTPIDVSQSDLRPLVRGELETLDDTIAAALGRYRSSNERMDRLHLEDARARIDAILNPDG